MIASPRYFRFAARLWPFALVACCGLTLGYFAIRTYVSPLPRQYQLDFGNASWIEPADPSPVAYFRKKIFLSDFPDQAWIQIAATDSYKLTINGKRVGIENFLKTRVAGIYDIKTHLTTGTNVIGLEVNRTSYPGSSQLLVKGAVKQAGQKAITFISDEHWKVATYTGIVQGSEPWNSPLVEDELWPSAQRAAVSPKEQINWVGTSPLLLQLPATGKWLLAHDAPHQAIFSTSLFANSSRQETWIQVASSGNLDLLINNTLVTSVPTTGVKAKQMPRLSPAVVTPRVAAEQQPSSDVSTANVTSLQQLTFESYDISPWIRRGQNRIVAAVRSSLSPAMFIAEGFTVRNNGNVQPFQTDSSWQLLGLSSGPQTPETGHAIEGGGNGSAPWGYLREGFVKQPQLTDFGTVANSCVTIFLIVFLVIAGWLVAAWSAAVLKGEPIRSTLARDALLHVPITLALFTGVLLCYDYRFPNNWAFQPRYFLGAIAALLVIRLLHLLAGPAPKLTTLSKRMLWNARTRHLLPYFALAAIVVFGGVLRFHNLGYMSFDHDEMGLVQKSRGVFQRGFPYNEYAGGVIRAATTYELVPYFLAVSGAIFGYTEWGMRLPSCIWGTLTIALLGLMGRRLFNWRTGLITALIYACMVTNIRWAQNAFYCQQCQFLSMLTFWLFYEAIRTRPFQRRYVTATSIAFCLAYLSWEGSGLILPALFVALVIVRWGQWWWLKEWHAYRCVFFVAVLVIAQYCWRTLAGTPVYLAIGSGLSTVAGPSLFFLNYAYQPTYYIEKLLLAENHVAFTLLALAGCLFCWNHAGFRYIASLLASFIILYSDFLSALSPRYCYFFQPLVLLAGVAAAVVFYRHLVAIAHRAADWPISPVVARFSGLALLGLLFAQSNEWLVKAYSLSGEGNAPGLMTRMDTYRYDYREAARYVRSHVQPNDLIVVIVSHCFEYYSGLQGDYYLDSLLAKKVVYSERGREPVFIEKFRGNPTIRNATELQEVTHRGRRTWVVFVPFASITHVASPDVLDYLRENSKSVYESYRAKVFLIEGANQPTSVANSR